MANQGTFEVIETDEDAQTSLGVVTLDAQGMLAIVSLEPDPDGQLQTIVEELNREEVLHQDAAPPAGARQFEVFSRTVTRGTPEFLAALREHLQRYFGIELRPK